MITCSRRLGSWRVAGRRCDGFVADQVGDLVAAGLKGLDLGTEFAKSRAGVFLVHGAVLERRPVFVACRGLGGDGGFDGVEFTEASEKLAEVGAEITMLYAEIDDLTGQLAEEQKVCGRVEDLRLGWELGEIELTDLERDNERLHARIRWLESELTAHHVHVAGQESPGQIILPGNVVETLELAAWLSLLSIGATSDAGGRARRAPPGRTVGNQDLGRRSRR
ncbi:hypothetical protein O7634_10680 [Micromonospora sp. WMMD1120]|uniref:hypothetical protein n=1 Tax=Micromonospora sp. WMMD1120 TaxID=3016106 RepID=UPI002415F106|nr:hypothetical protein [Micromonospora sp. WMMD1120]MDG4807211.1 hypothetical protein [Micromonospora sp. WMMD1120]